MNAKTSFTNIIKRITGVSTPVFGISWNAPEPDRDKAQQLLIYLEDQRLLLGNYYSLIEHRGYVEEALFRLRNELTTVLKTLNRTSPLAESVSVMRASCRKCLDKMYSFPLRTRKDYHIYGDHIDEVVWVSLGELRAVFGFHIAQICSRYDLAIEEELKSILSLLDEEGAHTTENSASQMFPD